MDLKCLHCVVERKVTEMNGALLTELPELRDAVTLMGGQAVCYEHIAVERQSPLLAAAQQQATPPISLDQFRSMTSGLHS